MKRLFLTLVTLLFTTQAQAAILVFSPNGSYTTKTSLSAAAAAADTASKTVVVTSALSSSFSNISSATLHAWPSDRKLKVEKGGSIGNTTAFKINAPFEAGSYPIFTGTGKVLIDSGDEINATWFATSGTGTYSSPWIIDLSKVMAAAGYSNSQNGGGVVFDTGYYRVSSVTEMNPASSSKHVSLRARVPGSTYIMLANAANCSILKWSDGIGYSHNATVDGIIFDGNASNQTVAHPLVEVNAAYSMPFTRCIFQNSKGEGLKLDITSPSIGGAAFNLGNNEYNGNVDGLVIQANGGPAMDYTISGVGAIQFNTGYGIHVIGTSGAVSNVNIRDGHFETNTLGDILYDNVAGGNINGNSFSVVATGTASVKLINGSNNVSIWGNTWNMGQNNIENTFYPLYFDATTFDNRYWANRVVSNASQITVANASYKIYDAGNNYSLDHYQNVVRTPENSVSNDNGAYGLSGPTGETIGLIANYLLYSSDLTNGAWQASGGTVVTNLGATVSRPPTYNPDLVSRVIFTAATDYLLQDVTVSAKAGEVFTFSFWAQTTSGSNASDEFTAFIGDVGSNFSQEVSIHPSWIPVSGKLNPWRRYSVSVVASVDASTMRVKFKPVANGNTIWIWGAQLNRGKLAPYIPTTTAAVTLFPGFKTSHLYADHGVSSGYNDLGSVSGSVGVSAIDGKNQMLTLSNNITSLSLSDAGMPGAELVLKIKQASAGGKTVSFYSTVKITGGAYTLTATANAVDVLSFFWDGVAWYEKSRVQDVK